MRRWAVEEIGRNSVSPWTRPSTMAWNVCMATWSGYGSEVRLPVKDLKSAEAAEQPVVRPVEVAGAGGEQAALLTRVGDEPGLRLGVGHVERLDAVQAEADET